VEYEGYCDPYEDSCFIYCEDDFCDEPFYYTKVIKHALDVHKQCGKYVTDCDSASVCLPGDRDCSVTYCDFETEDDCAYFVTSEGSFDELLDEFDSLNEEILQDNLNDSI
jgi:hypothetical protein